MNLIIQFSYDLSPFVRKVNISLYIWYRINYYYNYNVIIMIQSILTNI